MKIETQPMEDHQVKLTVDVEPESLEDAKRRAARHLSKHTKIPGFRPGKAPYPVIVRQIGEGAILEEAIEILVKDIYPKVIEESGVKPYGPGTLENIVSTEPPVLEFVVPLEAEVTLGDYRSIQKPYEPKEVTDEDVNAVLDNLRDRQAIVEPVDRPAQVDDVVTVRLSAERTHPQEGEDAALIRERSYPVTVKAEGELDDNEWPFPGFSSQVAGLSKGDERTVTHTFSEESNYESLRGIEAQFHLVVEDVKSRTLPELNDEFATTVGDYENMDSLKAEIRSGLEQQAKDSYDSEYGEEILEQVVEASTIKYPPQMLERETDDMIHNLGHRLEQQNLDMDIYLKSRGINMDDLRKEIQPAAETRLKKSLALMEVAKAENIEISPEDLQNETMETIQSLAQSLPEKEARKLNNRNVFSGIVNNLIGDMLVRRSMDRLRAIASGREEEQPQEEAVESPASETELAAADAALSDETGTAQAETESAAPVEPDQETSEE